MAGMLFFIEISLEFLRDKNSVYERNIYERYVYECYDYGKGQETV